MLLCKRRTRCEARVGGSNEPPWMASNKRWALALLVVLLALLAAGCTRQKAESDQVTLVLAYPADQKTRPLYRETVARFERKHPGIRVRLLEIPKDYYRKVLVMIAGRNAPDLMWMGQSFAEFATRGAFLDITDRVARELNLEEYLPQAIEWYRIEGKQLGIPFGVDMEFIAYNKTLFDEAGVEYPRDDWTHEEFLEKAKRLTKDRNGDGRIDQYGFRGGLDCSAFGAQILAEDGSRACCNTPQMVRHLQFHLDLAHKWRVAPLPDAIQQEGLDIYAAFRQGRAAMMRMYTWDLPALREQCREIDWDIVNGPKVNQRGYWASSQAVLISSQTRHPDEAWLLCKEFFGPEFQRSMAQRGLPTNLKIAREVIAANRERPANLAALLKGSNALYPFPRVAHLSELLQHWWNASESVNCLRATPEVAVARAERAINRAIARGK